ncbi:unnamed protein product [Caenorhabditis angaria]|uniref:Uncharacterized protein n=1 Tax=Caenorhabditis angaria TaxID=860376 RepID=A0A9P1MXT1_9PELO|nr:unnamed protein product [Caenorhabditis angaria]
MQQLNEDEERKKATLAKQHTETSRTANLSKNPKQDGFGFGSATPRTLTYLDNLQKSEQLYDKRLKLRSGPIESGLTVGFLILNIGKLLRFWIFCRNLA